MIEERLEASGGGTVELEPTAQLRRMLGDIDTLATSWVMVTPGRIPAAAFAGMDRSSIAALSAASALVTALDRSPSGRVSLGLSGFSHYLTDAAGQTSSGLVAGGYAGTGVSLAGCLSRVSRTDFLATTKIGLANRGAGSPLTVDLDNGDQDPLQFLRWVAAAFRASWRVSVQATGNGTYPWYPITEIAPLEDLWGSALLPRILITPDLPSSPPIAGTWLRDPNVGPARVVNGLVSRKSDGAGMISDAWVHGTSKREGIPATVGRATKALGIAHPNGLGPLGRHKRYESAVTTAAAAQLNSVAASILGVDGAPVESWDVDIPSPVDICRVPLGAPVGLQDLDAGIMSLESPSSVGSMGAAPVLGLRVVGRRLPWRDGMGCYLAHAGRGWGVFDLSDAVAAEVAGTVEVARTLARQSMASALTGIARV